mmetsp:Transcript_62282/g.131681  ORF Transcript_62282/g.131681 Transcript_62282/m.131681 type:complete len:288 (-) Transcript_62282:136-999(-)|eukprot:CAMPEP_0206461008 /NCGR_PEP_ID=MMETSP0324_2-20121206/25085_1 /ASSEMBLY_ACC=CAM_ASM_000836 /TAXON_ID=2866 /ORGANISM="Crypthecodinium cohnii, Strain Seligo" /LENGTH=287 /DNA_ID=CAMNT_0053932807 /DNA_START=74 /DNA_END=937 /DNA_ORIENTATION=+
MSEEGDEREIQASELEIVKKIGEGTTAVVFLGKLRGVVVAVKEIGALSEETDVGTIQAVQRELRVLTNVSHPNIVRFVGLVTETLPLRLVLEYCAGGSLFELLHNNWQVELSCEQRLKMLLDTTLAEEYLHCFDPPIIHRDLKSLNLMLLEPIQDNKTVPHVKLADFGFARLEERYMTQGVGTKHWMAPEVQKGTKYTTKADVFSFAMVAFEVSFRHVPFESLDATEVARRIIAGERPKMDDPNLDEVPPEGVPEIIEECWAQDPEARPSFEEVKAKVEKLYLAVVK